MKKMISVVIAMFVVVTSCFGQPKPSFYVPPPGLPKDLQIGSINMVLNHAVTNFESEVNLFIQSASGYGKVNTIHGPFKSYADFQYQLMTNCWYMFSFQNWNQTLSPDEDLTVIVLYLYQLADLKYYSSFSINTNIGHIKDISEKSFMDLPPVGVVNTVIPVLDLQKFSIEVPGVYTNHWDRHTAAKDVDGFPPELTSAITVSLSEWYSIGTNATITIATSKESAQYTGDGGKKVPPVFRNMSPKGFDLIIPKGQEVTIQSATNVVGALWSDFVKLDWTLHTNQVHVNICPNAPQQFFRTKW